MFKKSIALAALVSVGLLGAAPVVSAHNGYKPHVHKQKMQKHNNKNKFQKQFSKKQFKKNKGNKGKWKFKNQNRNRHANNRFGNRNFNRRHRNNNYQRSGYRNWGYNPVRRVRSQLRNRGFYNIRFTDRRLPVFKVYACRNGNMFKMKIDRDGDILRRKWFGNCN